MAASCNSGFTLVSGTCVADGGGDPGPGPWYVGWFDVSANDFLARHGPTMATTCGHYGDCFCDGVNDCGEHPNGALVVYCPSGTPTRYLQCRFDPWP